MIMAPSDSTCPQCGAAIGPGVFSCPRCGTGIPVPEGARTTLAAPPGPPPDGGRNAQLDALREAALGEYEVLAELGHGGMATVFLAHDLALDRKVAIKVLAPALLLMGEGMVERFKREARTAAALSHPHIIPIYAVKESADVLYFVMKYVQGRALDAVIRDVGQLPISMVQAILAQVSDALGYAHRHGVIHRDVKSANIMLDEDGWAVVTDFGIAKVVQAEGLTLTGVTVGTPTYMSPEQCDMRDVTGASDQYSLGVVAYEMLTGQLPFKGDSTMSVMYAHFNEPPRPVTELRPDCPPNLGAGVMRMLEKEPSRRWPSMDDVVAVCGRPSLRHDDPVRREMITLAKAGASAHLVAQLNTPTSPIVLSRQQTRRGAAPVPARRASKRWWGLVGAAALTAAVWWLAPWRGWQRTTTATAPVSPPPRDTVPRVAAVEPRPDTAVRAAVPAHPPTPRRREPPAERAPAQSPPATQRVDTLVRMLRGRALAAMSRALEAGATSADLARGDSVFKGAESLAARGQPSDAMVQLATAASLWAEAERVSRSRPPRDSAPARAVEPPPAAAPPVARPPADPRVEIQALITDYARALESRDLAEVRRVYPGLTSPEQATFSQFFASVSELKAGLTINRLIIAGGSADAFVSGVYEYHDTKTGRSRRDTTTFRATLLQDSTGWHLASIRSVR
jgi:protein kinase-like protein